MRRFECEDNGGAKFWEVEVHGATVVVRFGKLGAKGQRKETACGSAAVAANEVSRLVREKTRKGYVEVGRAVEALPSTPELERFRAAEDPFYGSSAFGEVRFLAAGDVPAMRRHAPDAPVWGRADWFAEEADGGVLGLLRVEAAPRPVVLLDTEGCLKVSGACLVDHFGSHTRAADDGVEALAPLSRFCAANVLPRWRDLDTVRALAEAAGVGAFDISTCEAFDAQAWAREVAGTQPGPATEAPTAPPARVGAGGPARPMADVGAAPFRSGTTRDGLAWFVQPRPSTDAALWVWTGERFDLRETLPGIAEAYGYDATTEVVLGGGRALVRDRGAWRELALPEELDLRQPLSSHGSGPLYALGASGALYALVGGALAPVEGVPAKLHGRMARDGAGGLYFVGGLTPDRRKPLRDVLYVADGVVRKLPPAPAGDILRDAAVVGGRLAVLGEWVHALDLAGGPWRSSARLSPAPSAWFGALADGRAALVREDDKRIHAFDLGTLVPEVVGTLVFKPNRSQSLTFDAAGRLVGAGGALGRPDSQVPCEPQIWEAGNGTECVPGAKAQAQALVELERKRFPGVVGGSVFYAS